MCASMGWLTVMLPGNSYGRKWRVTPAGLAITFE